MCWLVAGLYCLSAVCQFVGVVLIYNIDKKTLATMKEELAARHAGEAAPIAPEVANITID
jgi:hypothetical protein